MLTWSLGLHPEPTLLTRRKLPRTAPVNGSSRFGGCGTDASSSHPPQGPPPRDPPRPGAWRKEKVLPKTSQSAGIFIGLASVGVRFWFAVLVLGSLANRKLAEICRQIRMSPLSINPNWSSFQFAPPKGKRNIRAPGLAWGWLCSVTNLLFKKKLGGGRGDGGSKYGLSNFDINIDGHRSPHIKPRPQTEWHEAKVARQANVHTRKWSKLDVQGVCKQQVYWTMNSQATGC